MVFSLRRWALKVESTPGSRITRIMYTVMSTVKAPWSKTSKISIIDSMNLKSLKAVRSTWKIPHSSRLPMLSNSQSRIPICGVETITQETTMSHRCLAKYIRISNSHRRHLRTCLVTIDAQVVLVRHPHVGNLKSFDTLVKTITPWWRLSNIICVRVNSN